MEILSRGEVLHIRMGIRKREVGRQGTIRHALAGGAVALDSEGRTSWRGMSWRADGCPIDLVVPV